MTRLLVVAIVLLCAACNRAPALSEAQPNILFVLADDLNTRLLPYLPGLERMTSARGLALQMTVPTPICAPSRATILTGRYAHNTMVKGNGPARGGIWAFQRTGAEKSTFATWLRDVGYHTGFFGKYLNDQDQADQPVPPGWELWVGYGKMTMSRFGYQVIEAGQPVRVIEKEYDSDFFAARANDWLEKVPEPFLAVWCPMSPHGPFVPPKRHVGRFDGVKFAWPPSFAANEEEVAKLTRTRLEMMLGFEDGLRAMLATLEKRGVLDRTYLFLTSDHGLFMGEHGFAAGKGETYDETTRVPLFVRGPGVPVGRSDALVASTDIAPTLAAIGGAAVPPIVDGRSILPLLHGAKVAAPRQRMLLEWFDQDGTSPWLALREANDKYVRTKDGACLHFDMKNDPYEMSPTRCDERQAKRAASTLELLSTCSGSACADVEDRP